MTTTKVKNLLEIGLEPRVHPLFSEILQKHLTPYAGHCDRCGAHRDALCSDGLCWNCSPLGAARKPHECEPMWTGKELQ